MDVAFGAGVAHTAPLGVTDGDALTDSVVVGVGASEEGGVMLPPREVLFHWRCCT